MNRAVVLRTDEFTRLVGPRPTVVVHLLSVPDIEGHGRGRGVNAFTS
jgi:hypothetical protein